MNTLRIYFHALVALRPLKLASKYIMIFKNKDIDKFVESHLSLFLPL